MNKQLLILFGLPGAGKSYVGEIINNHYGYFLYDGDKEIPLEMKKALLERKPVSEKMRQKFQERIFKKIIELNKRHNKLVFMQALLKDDLRQKIHQTFPQAKFFLIKCPDEIREARYIKRNEFNLGLSYLRKTSVLFEEPTIPYTQINNKKNGSEEIIKQLNVDCE